MFSNLYMLTLSLWRGSITNGLVNDLSRTTTANKTDTNKRWCYKSNNLPLLLSTKEVSSIKD